MTNKIINISLNKFNKGSMQTIIKHEYRDTRDKSSQFQTQSS